MEIEKPELLKLVHDLNTALYHAESVSKDLKKITVDRDTITLQDSATEKIKKALSFLLKLSKESQ